MEETVMLMAICAVLFLVGGSICGIIAFASLNRMKLRLELAEKRILSLRADVRNLSVGEHAEETGRQPEAPVPPRPVTPPEIPAEIRVAPAEAGKQAGPVPPPPPPMWTPSPAPQPAAARLSEALHMDKDMPIEMFMGMKGILWLGGLTFLVGLALFLKYSIDNNWIGPAGRIALGVLAGLGALIAAERFRKKGWPTLFQGFTGGGIAALYICVFYAFRVYEAQTATFVLASMITVFAVVMAVAHNAMAVAILAVLGGFMSPVLLSTGANHPYVLFTYIAILDLVAVGAAYFRKWRALDLLCFAGTVIMYQGWYAKFYGAPNQPSQMPPALIFTSIFYLMFLLIPLLNSLVRRLPETYEGLALLAVNAALSFISYYRVLYEPHRYALGFVALGQAALVFLLFRAWLARVGKDKRTTSALLIITLALVTLAIPIQLKLYGIPLAWATEAVVIVFIGTRFDHKVCRAGGFIALALATGGLLHRLPLHKLAFTPVLNVPFGSWAFVIAAAALASWLQHRKLGENTEPWAPAMVVGGALLAFVLGCALLTLETYQFWDFRGFERLAHTNTYRYGSLVVLWSVIPLLTALALHRFRFDKWMPLAAACYAVAALFFLASLEKYSLESTALMLNATFLPRLAFPVSLWVGGGLMRRAGKTDLGNLVTVAGHMALAMLTATEMNRWSYHSKLVSREIGLSLISAAWAVHAFALIALGVATRNRARRALGFVLFAVTLGKVWIVDLSAAEPIYRILSFIATGLLTLPIAYFYHRFSARIMGKQDTEGKE